MQKAKPNCEYAADGRVVLPIFEAAYWQDPYPYLRAAREAGRTAVTPKGETVILSMRDAEDAMTHPALVTLGAEEVERLGIKDGPVHRWRALSINGRRGEEHRRLRRFVVPHFTARHVAQVRPRLRQHAIDLLDARTDGRIEIVSQFADPLPVWLIFEFLGIPPEDREELEQFVIGTDQALTEPIDETIWRALEAGIERLNQYVDRLISFRARHPEDDFLSELVAANEDPDTQLPREEFIALVVNLIAGAIGSSRASIANALLLIVGKPDCVAALNADLEKVTRAVEECLRFAPPSRFSRRMFTEDVHVAGQSVKEGEYIYFTRHAVNRDPAVWTDPDDFDIDREQRRNMSFGYGPHFCIGQALARADIEEALIAFLTVCGEARLLLDAPQRVPFILTERLESLPIAFRPASMSFEGGPQRNG
jgi:cytochrome P450